MKPSVEQIENLLALRRDERPEEGYWQDFLCEFHQRQRQRTVVGSGLKGFLLKTGEWFTELGPSKWAYGAGLAYASVAAMALLMPREAQMEQATPTAPVNYQVVPAPTPSAEQFEQLDALDLNPSTEGNAGEQVF